MSKGVNIGYLVHDLGDPAVARRVAMFRKGGASVDLYGFHRGDAVPSAVEGVTPRDLGQTKDGKLALRALSVLYRRASVGSWAQGLKNADVIVARQLETLVLACAAKKRLGLSAPIVYELLDVHGVMVKDHPASALLRRYEGALLNQCAAVMLSSPAFEREYLAKHHPRRPASILVENKVFSAQAAPLPPSFSEPASPGPASSVPAPGPPWKLGWFGVIRCKRSLACLAALARSHPDLVEIHIHGRIANTDMGDVDALLKGIPNLRYHGPYRYPDDLPRIYGGVHFVWAIDFYEAGFNSAWLLPNRLYEGGLHGVVPIALDGTETARWLDDHGVGLKLPSAIEDHAAGLFSSMTPAAYRTASRNLRTLNPETFYWADAACERLTRQLGNLSS
ncbi:MAG TPA: glycosyl transferase family 1 [Candidatus Sulfotelmatobacter sp.]|nr:glycosyl transferase family 1 [Candidatus Sulfotelmatobacter sp.]